jgi:hypothetical protein
LPDGLFSYQKSKFGQIFEGLRWENVALIYGRLEYFTNIWDVLRPFGTFCANLVDFFPVLVSCTKKNLATLLFISECFSADETLSRKPKQLPHFKSPNSATNQKWTLQI